MWEMSRVLSINIATISDHFEDKGTEFPVNMEVRFVTDSGHIAIKVTDDGKLQIRTNEGKLVLEPIAANQVELDARLL